MLKHFKISIILILCISVAGCATMPKDLFKPSENALKQREIQIREFDTLNETQMLSACAGVLQDLGFTLDESDKDLGVLVGSKERDASDAGQLALAITADLLAAFCGVYSNTSSTVDHIQRIQSAVVSRLSLKGENMIVRVSFQRIVWNRAGQLSRIEFINDPELYQGFFDKLSKSAFLEEHEI
ncbi:MAG: hypothetical protein HQ594_00150 [Candidatus Omnitrophica bacterium]|nr:hypothetical protein [Candidatus Omnitrophota bacterium]